MKSIDDGIPTTTDLGDRSFAEVVVVFVVADSVMCNNDDEPTPFVVAA